MDDFNDVQAKAAFDRTMLKTLLIEFLRDTNIPFVVVNNSKFRAIIRFICPSVILPSNQELIKHNIFNYELFKRWEKASNSDMLNDERLSLVELWARNDLKRGQVRISRKEQSLAELLKIDPATLTSAVPGFQPKDTILWTLSAADSKKHMDTITHGNKYEYLRPDQNDLDLSDTDIKDEISDDGNEIKPSLDGLAMVASLWPDPCVVFNEEGVYSPKYKNPTVRRTPALIRVKDQPGFIKYPCIVCNQRKETQQVRTVTNADAFIMIFSCVTSGQYSLKQGKELARMTQFKVCKDHLSELYSAVKKHLGVSNPKLDIHTENDKVVEAFRVVRELRDSRYLQKAPLDSSTKLIKPFIASLQNFFVTYGRQNYKAWPGLPGFLVEKESHTNF